MGWNQRPIACLPPTTHNGIMARGVDRLVRLFRPTREPRDPLDFRPKDRRLASRIAVEREALLTWNEQRDEQRLAVRVFDRSPEGLGLVLPRQLPIGLLAKIRWDDATAIQAVVRHCSARESQFVAGLMHLPVQRRAADRKPVQKTGKLYWDDLFDGRLASSVELRDVSIGGLCCQAARSIPVPLIVCLGTADWQYYGVTRYCTKVESGYVVGIQVIRSELSEEPGLLLR
jgi:hypothetical protein